MHLPSYFNQESERLIYRKLEPKDLKIWVLFFEDRESLRFFGLDGSKSNQEMAEVWFEKQFVRYTESGTGMLAVIEKESQKLIGMSGVLLKELDGRDEYEIAYSFKAEHRGIGYATEAARHMCAYAQEHIATDRFISIIHTENEKSKNVARKNGMTCLFQTEYLGMKVDVFGVAKAS
jgi:RimJ/RimL family protein N-acetyltransferase